MVDRLVDLPQDLRQARGDAGQPRTARADDRIARSRFGGEDRRVLGTAGDLDIGDTAQEVGFEVGRRVLLDDDIVLDLDGDADLLDVAGVDPDLLDPAGWHAVVLDDRALPKTAYRATEIDVVDGVLRRQLGPGDPQHAAEADRDQDQHEDANRDIMCSCFHVICPFLRSQAKPARDWEPTSIAGCCWLLPSSAARPRGPWK